jgi:hypothetical protein
MSFGSRLRTGGVLQNWLHDRHHWLEKPFRRCIGRGLFVRRQMGLGWSAILKRHGGAVPAICGKFDAL